ncbi:MAG: hypothetical protein Q9220_001122 [cf. Caloplaca sp. 1 TL-2023]
MSENQRISTPTTDYLSKAASSVAAFTEPAPKTKMRTPVKKAHEAPLKALSTLLLIAFNIFFVLALLIRYCTLSIHDIVTTVVSAKVYEAIIYPVLVVLVEIVLNSLLMGQLTCAYERHPDMIIPSLELLGNGNPTALPAQTNTSTGGSVPANMVVDTVTNVVAQMSPADTRECIKRLDDKSKAWLLAELKVKAS